MKNIIDLVNITKVYENDTVLNSINISIKRNEFFTLLGPSGCGKTTTLRLIAGFELPDVGSIYFDGQIINSLPPYKRNLNTVFQRYALFPHMNVFENIAFGLKVNKIPKALITQEVEKTLEIVGLQGFSNRKIDSLSGGQQQRVAIARAIVKRPPVLLLDEPLGALDLKLRKEMQTELKKIQRQLGITFIYVTHDQEEALTMSDFIAVMNGGILQQVGSPMDIYNEPVNAFVANFIGDSNIIEGVMIRDFEVEFAGGKFECVDKGFGENATVDIVIRPEDLKIISPNEGMFRGVVTSVVFKGVHYEMMVKTKHFEFIVHSTLMESVGTEVGLFVIPFDIQVMRKPTDCTEQALVMQNCKLRERK